MNELTLKKMEYMIGQRISGNLVEDVEVNANIDHITDTVVLLVRMNLLSKDAGIYTYREPKTWRDHLKQDNKWIRKLFGNPEYKVTKLMLRCVLDPQSKQFAIRPEDREMRIVAMDNIRAWDDMYQESEVLEYNEMEFYPTIYKMTE